MDYEYIFKHKIFNCTHIENQIGVFGNDFLTCYLYSCEINKQNDEFLSYWFSGDSKKTFSIKIRRDIFFFENVFLLKINKNKKGFYDSFTYRIVDTSSIYKFNIRTLKIKKILNGIP